MSPLLNTDERYGAVTKTLHWLVFLLLVHQFVVAAAMLDTPDGETTAGFTQGVLYEWHKSIGLIALGIAVLRYVWRRATPLPDWAPGLTHREKRAIHIIERVLYTCMFLMPLSGFVFVMAGGFGVRFLNGWQLPNLIGKHQMVASVAQRAHEVTAIMLVVALLAHWTVVFRRQQVYKDRYLQRMLPSVNQQ